jgi:glycosyltransferase involved in cell wall biosynthesis
VVEILIPVGPKDKAEWIRRSISSALSQGHVTVIDNSDREDLAKIIDEMGVDHVKIPRMKKINMAHLRNVMVSYTKERFVIMLDSDVVLPKEGALKMEEKLKNEGYSLTWMHYAYSEDELNKPLSPGEENPNLGCAGIDILALKKVGMFDEKYERDEDVWIYSKFKKEKFKVGPTEGRCLHLNKTHARLTLSDSLIEAKRNFWRSKYDMMLVLDGLTNVTFLSGYSYFGSYYIIGILSIFFYPILLAYIPLIWLGIKYYGGIKRYFYNLIPGLALAASFPYGLGYSLIKRAIYKRA